MRLLPFLTRSTSPTATFCDACGSVCDESCTARTTREAALDRFAARLAL